MQLQKIINILSEIGADAILLCNESNMHYVCGFSPSEGMILITKNGGCHIVDSRYTEAALLHAEQNGLAVTEIRDTFQNEVKKLLEAEKIHTLAIENETISLKQFTGFQQSFQTELLNLDSRIESLRNQKEPFEIELIKKANRIAEKSFLELLNEVKPGKTERELAALFDYIMAKNGSFGPSFDTILLTGAHTSMPHGVPGDHIIKEGDFVLFDFGATYQGYHSDMTRTVAVGGATEEMQETYRLVKKAQAAGIKALNSGVRCADVYRAAYDVLEKKNMGKYFRHSLGHGIGLDIHEGYNASPKSRDIYQTGNVTSIEPGVYIPDKFGIRIEDMLYLSPRGRENLSNITKELIIL